MSFVSGSNKFEDALLEMRKTISNAEDFFFFNTEDICKSIGLLKPQVRHCCLENR
jgi:hypothetical protein